MFACSQIITRTDSVNNEHKKNKSVSQQIKMILNNEHKKNKSWLVTNNNYCFWQVQILSTSLRLSKANIGPVYNRCQAYRATLFADADDTASFLNQIVSDPEKRDPENPTRMSYILVRSFYRLLWIFLIFPFRSRSVFKQPSSHLHKSNIQICGRLMNS